MDTTGMVGSMGLTFFCNKCVEVFFKFRRDEPVSNELEETCKQAISAFKSLKWPEETGVPNGEKIALFNTNEEIESFTRVLLSEEGDADVALNTLISDLEFVFQEQSLEKRKKPNQRDYLC